MEYKNILYSSYRDEISKYERFMMNISRCPYCISSMSFPKHTIYSIGRSRYEHVCGKCGFTIDENFLFHPHRFTNDGIDEHSIGKHKARIMKIKQIIKKSKHGVDKG